MIGFFGVQNGLNLAPYLTPQKIPLKMSIKKFICARLTSKTKKCVYALFGWVGK